MKVDRGFEVLFVPESSRGVLHPLDLSVDRFTGCVGNPMFQISQNICESSFQGASYFNYGL